MNQYLVTVRFNADPTASAAFSMLPNDAQVELINVQDGLEHYEIQTERNIALLLDQSPGVVSYEENLNYDPQ